jgi:predicted RND superfamily exporter protein
MRSIGEIAVLGIALSLFAALFLLPALLRVLEMRETPTSEPKEV